MKSKIIKKIVERKKANFLKHKSGNQSANEICHPCTACHGYCRFSR
ncbi:hypothetical protein ACFORL_09465 [Legionella dresdenensis]|uniref:Uncharacterized protein n=1 Tax=Legionella dresdenensis TaxID=450200 RepID=A0ABV8CGS4_9GAMM